MATFDEVNSKMLELMGDKSSPERASIVLSWWSEFPERNFVRMKRCVELLTSIPYERFHVPDDMKQEIKQIGMDIDKEGGFQTLQACFYIVINFMVKNIKEKHKVKSIEYLWNGVGDWKN